MTLPGVAIGTPNRGYRSSLRPEMLAFLPANRQGRKVLEIGCGEGRFVAALEGTAEAWGIEPDAASASVAATHLHRLFNGTFEQAKPDLPRGYFDVVICNDVIEHMLDSDAFLRSIQDHLADGGHLVGSIPNVRYYRNLFNLLIAADWEYESSGILDHTHFRFFTMKSLRRALERAGFQVEQMRSATGGIEFHLSAWGIARWTFAWALILLSAGRASDVSICQIGFRALCRPGAAQPR